MQILFIRLKLRVVWPCLRHQYSSFNSWNWRFYHDIPFSHYLFPLQWNYMSFSVPSLLFWASFFLLLLLRHVYWYMYNVLIYKYICFQLFILQIANSFCLSISFFILLLRYIRCPKGYLCTAILQSSDVI